MLYGSLNHAFVLGGTAKKWQKSPTNLAFVQGDFGDLFLPGTKIIYLYF
jgi:hypothetical protein